MSDAETTTAADTPDLEPDTKPKPKPKRKPKTADHQDGLIRY